MKTMGKEEMKEKKKKKRTKTKKKGKIVRAVAPTVCATLSKAVFKVVYKAVRKVYSRYPTVSGKAVHREVRSPPLALFPPLYTLLLSHSPRPSPDNLRSNQQLVTIMTLIDEGDPDRLLPPSLLLSLRLLSPSPLLLPLTMTTVVAPV